MWGGGVTLMRERHASRGVRPQVCHNFVCRHFVFIFFLALTHMQIELSLAVCVCVLTQDVMHACNRMQVLPNKQEALQRLLERSACFNVQAQ